MVLDQYSLAFWLVSFRELSIYTSPNHCAPRRCDMVYGILLEISSNYCNPLSTKSKIYPFNLCSSIHCVMHHRESINTTEHW